MIALHDVSLTYDSTSGKIDALRGVELQVDSGEFVAVLGPSGCGKTTLLKLIAGLLDPGCGRIEVLGMSPEDARQSRKVGFVFQSPALFPWLTVRQNVGLPNELHGELAANRDLVEDLIKMVGLVEFSDKYPWELSGGMQQRVSFARALSFDPAVLLMDEPFSAVDAFTRSGLQDMLLDAWSRNRKTILYVTHDSAEAAFLADRVVVLSERPAYVKGEVRVGFQRPRNRGLRFSSEFAEVLQSVYQLIAPA